MNSKKICKYEPFKENINEKVFKGEHWLSKYFLAIMLYIYIYICMSSSNQIMNTNFPWHLKNENLRFSAIINLIFFF